MARATFDAVIDKVLAHEGGFVNHPKDPGGATNKGITLKTFQQWRRTQGHPTPRVDDLRKITTAEVKLIYRQQYWDSVKGDKLPAGIDYLALDYAINSGPGRAIKDLQKTLRVKADGVLGAETLDAINREAERDELAFVERYAAMRLAFMKSLKIWSTFGKGWSVRVADVKKNGIQLAKNDTLYGVTYVAGGNAKALDTQKKFTATLTANVRSASASAGGISAIGATATDLAQQLEPLRYNEGLQFVQYLFIALMFVGFAVSAYAIWKRLDDKNEARAQTDYELDELDLEEVGAPA